MGKIRSYLAHDSCAVQLNTISDDISRMKKVMKITTNQIQKMKRQFCTILKIYLWAGMERWVFVFRKCFAWVIFFIFAWAVFGVQIAIACWSRHKIICVVCISCTFQNISRSVKLTWIKNLRMIRNSLNIFCTNAIYTKLNSSLFRMEGSFKCWYLHEYHIKISSFLYLHAVRSWSLSPHEHFNGTGCEVTKRSP